MLKTKKDTGYHLRLIVKTSFFIFLSIIVSKIFSYIYKVIIARTFGPEPFGLFSLAIIISGLFITFALFGLSDGLVRFIPYYRGKKSYEKIKHIIKISLAFTLATSVISAILLYIFSDTIALAIFHNSELSIYLKIISFVGPFAAISGIFLPVLRGFERVKTYTLLINVLQNGSKLLLVVLFIYLGFGANSLTLSYLFSFIFLALFSYLLGRKILKTIKIDNPLSSTEKKRVASELISYSWPLVFVGLLYTLFYWTDSLVLGYFQEAVYVGIYNAAITLVTLFSIAPDLFMQLFLPMVTAKYSENKKVLIKDLTKQVSKWIYMINLPLFMVIIAFPGVIINFFFGPEFLAAEIPLRILAFGALFSGFLSLLFGLISMRGESKTILNGYLVFAAINLILDISLVKAFGMVGAAIATSIVWILFNISMTLIVKRRLGFFPYKGVLVKITLVTAILLALLLVAANIIVPTLINLIIVGISFSLIYISLIFFTGCLDKNDWMILGAILAKVRTLSGFKISD